MRLLCIDFSNLIVRHNANPYGQATDLLGRPVHGAVGAVGQVLRVLEREQPTHLLIARDGRRQDSFRRELFAGYKAHRPDADEDLSRQFELAYQALEVFTWPVVAYPRHEADDVIASAAVQFPGSVDILTGDKDLLAVINDHVRLLLLRPGEELTVDAAGCQRLLGVRPEQVRDYKALVGDSSDGIPGIAGVGAKSAVALLAEYQNLAGIYAHLASGQPLVGIGRHIGAKVAAGQGAAELSWQLAGMVETIPLDWAALADPIIPDDRVYGEALEALGLRALRRQLPHGPRSSQAPVGPVDLDAVFRQLGN
jgi:DNA polymerase-1